MDAERGFLIALVLAFAAVSALFVLPYRQYVLLAVLLVYLLYPLQRRLEPRIGSRPSAALLIVATTLVILVPLGALLVVAGRQAVSIGVSLMSGDLGIERIESIVNARLGTSVDLSQVVANANLDPSTLLDSLNTGSGVALFDTLSGVLGGLSTAAIGITVLLFLVYYLLTDGAELVAWFREAAPLSSETASTLVSRLDRLMWAVLVGNLVVGVVQGVLTGLGFVALGISNAIFWTVLTTALGLLPLIGASVIWIPTAGYLFIANRPLAAAALFVYGALVVSLSDNYLRPMIGGREANLNPALFVLGIFGGLVALGFMGLFFGPVIIGALQVLVELATRRPAPVQVAK
jgi:predicted PurR-regulated permease PerM